jgi:hypothetical protein
MRRLRNANMLDIPLQYKATLVWNVNVWLQTGSLIVKPSKVTSPTFITDNSIIYASVVNDTPIIYASVVNDTVSGDSDLFQNSQVYSRSSIFKL